ncbi:hypothetical protein RUM43_002048 [Polyplax serrata]|uniref:Uncharacterized protein n=1 Tax=Polyplax serrata TaxID=468196 RepID=A0AAN8S949_POLSC
MSEKGRKRMGINSKDFKDKGNAVESSGSPKTSFVPLNTSEKEREINIFSFHCRSRKIRKINEKMRRKENSPFQVICLLTQTDLTTPRSQLSALDRILPQSTSCATKILLGDVQLPRGMLKASFKNLTYHPESFRIWSKDES